MSGISHILAISGLHISFIGMFLYSSMRRRFKFVASAAVSIITIVCFGIISGFGIATIRAVVMFGLKLLGEILGRNYDYLTAISTSGLLLLLSNPFVIYNSGFQLSFMAMIAITVVFPKVEELLEIKNGVLKAFLFSFHISFMMAA